MLSVLRGFALLLFGAAIIGLGVSDVKAGEPEPIIVGSGTFNVVSPASATPVDFRWYANSDGTQTINFTKKTDQSNYSSTTFAWTDSTHQNGHGTLVLNGVSYTVDTQWTTVTGGGTMVFNRTAADGGAKIASADLIY